MSTFQLLTQVGCIVLRNCRLFCFILSLGEKMHRLGNLSCSLTHLISKSPCEIEFYKISFKCLSCDVKRSPAPRKKMQLEVICFTRGIFIWPLKSQWVYGPMVFSQKYKDHRTTRSHGNVSCSHSCFISLQNFFQSGMASSSIMLRQ